MEFVTTKTISYILGLVLTDCVSEFVKDNLFIAAAPRKSEGLRRTPSPTNV